MWGGWDFLVVDRILRYAVCVDFVRCNYLDGTTSLRQ